MNDLKTSENRLRAGASKRDITPTSGILLAGFAARQGVSNGIHERLHARSIVITDGETKVGLTSCDLCFLPYDVARRMDEEVVHSGRLDAFLAFSTHTHSGPLLDEHYTQQLIKSVTDSIIEAAESMKPVRVGGGIGAIDGVSFNRRAPRTGRIDNEVTVLKIEEESGRPVAGLLNYACHPVILGPNSLLVSPDYPGLASEIMEENLGDGSVILFLNGASGNINPWTCHGYFCEGGTVSEVERMARTIGFEALKVWTNILCKEVNKIRFHRASFSLSSGIRSRSPIEVSEELVKKAERDLNRLKTKHVAAARKHRTREELTYFKMMRDLWIKKSGAPSDVPQRQGNINTLNIGEACLIGLSGEPFTEIGLKLKKNLHQKGFPVVLIAELCGGYVGYLPNRRAFIEGGYEPYVAELYGLRHDLEQYICSTVDKMITTPPQRASVKGTRPAAPYVLWHVPGVRDQVHMLRNHQR